MEKHPYVCPHTNVCNQKNTHTHTDNRQTDRHPLIHTDVDTRCGMSHPALLCCQDE